MGYRDRALRQSIGNDATADLHLRILTTAGGHRKILLAVNGIRRGRGNARRRHRVFPQELPRQLVERADLVVVDSCGDKKDAAFRHDSPTIVLTAGGGVIQLRIITEWNLPDISTRVEIQRIQRSPRRADRRVAIRVQELCIALEHIVDVPARVVGCSRRLRVVITDVSRQAVDLSLAQAAFKSGHPPRSMGNHLCDLLARHPLGQSKQCGERRGVALAVDAMATGAGGAVDLGSRGLAAGVLDPRPQLQDVGLFVGVDIENAGLGVPGSAAIFAATIQSRKDDGALKRGWIKAAMIAQRRQVRPHRRVGGGRALGQHLLRESLASERFRRRRQGLVCRELFARNGAWKGGNLLHRKYVFARDPVEHPDETVLRNLGYSRNVPTVTANGDERRWRQWIAIPHVVIHELMVPPARAGIGVKRHQRGAKERIALAIGPVEILKSHAGRRHRKVDNAALRIEAQTGPYVGTIRSFPCILGPRVITKFAGMRDRVKYPHQLAGAHVIGANMTGRRARATEDNEFFVDYAGRIDVHRYRAWISPKVLTQVDLAGIAESLDQFSGVGIYRHQSIARGEQNPLISSVGPVANGAQSPMVASR